MKEKEFLNELKAKGFHYTSPFCYTDYGDDLHLKLAKLAFVKNDRITTDKITYWLHFPGGLDEHITGVELRGFVGPDSERATFTFHDVLDSLGPIAKFKKEQQQLEKFQKKQNESD